jgi:hypothetical protein
VGAFLPDVRVTRSRAFYLRHGLRRLRWQVHDAVCT